MGERIAVLGLGRMGRAMAQTLADKGLDVTGWTRSGATSDDFTVAATLEEAASAADMLILSLLDDAAVRSVLDRLAGLDLSGRLVVETSTVSPAVVRDMAGRIEAAGGQLMDAPISGGPEMVASGTAGLLMGGREADMVRFEPVGAHLSNRMLRVGPLGSGAAAIEAGLGEQDPAALVRFALARPK
jgi:3-hydroxyisobutyrate dehydrogenase-like beta-hydroxyacid dehydrogenase